MALPLQHREPIRHPANWTLTLVNPKIMSQDEIITEEERDEVDLTEDNLVRLLTQYVTSVNENTYTQLEATATKRRKFNEHMDISRLLCEFADINPPIIKQLPTSLLYQAAQKFFSLNYKDCSSGSHQLIPDMNRTYESSLFNRALKQFNWIPEFYINENEIKPSAMWAGPLYDVCRQYHSLVTSTLIHDLSSSYKKQQQALSIMKSLLELGVEVNSISRLVGLSPLAVLARTTGSRDGIKLLAEHGAVLPDKYQSARQTTDAELDILQEITSERYCRNGDSKNQLLQMYIELKSNTKLVVKTLLANRDEFLSPELKGFLLKTQLITDQVGICVPSLKSLSRQCIRQKLGDVRVICNSYKLPIPAELQYYVALNTERQ